jgi:hypothetical protein
MDRRRRGWRSEPTETHELETLRGTAKRSDLCPHRSAAGECERKQAGERERERVAWRGREERADRLRARAREASVMSSSSSSRRRRRAHGRGPGRRGSGGGGTRCCEIFLSGSLPEISHGIGSSPFRGLVSTGFTHMDATDRSFPETGC